VGDGGDENVPSSSLDILKRSDDEQERGEELHDCGGRGSLSFCVPDVKEKMI
tara:strand:- start:81 stop:236 length:156 start_codon:yes stop_codon:yes gene_type:complete